MKAKKCENFDKFDFEPGSYCIMENGKLFMTLPCGDNFMPDGRWEEKDINDPNKITLMPSIFCSPKKPCWHGYLKNGEFITA